MTFPMITYKYHNIDGANKLAELVDQKFDSLSMFIAEGVSATCEVEFEKVGAHQQGKIHRVEANLVVNGVLHRAEAVEETYEAAIDEVRDELDKKLSRSKDKSKSLLRKAGQMMKERFGSGR